MSKRNERREAEREARKLNYQNLRQQNTQPSVVAAPETKALETDDTAQLLAGAQAFFETTPASESETPEINSISEAQLAANRANSLLSTGPVTSAGRARSSMNALKHGLSGNTVLLPHEDAAHYQRELDAYIEMYDPATEDELRLVQSQHDCIWRLSRIQRLESAILLKGHLEFSNKDFASKFEDRTPLELSHLIEAEAYLKYERQLRNLNIQEARLRRNMEKDRAELLSLQSTRRREELATAQSQIKQSQPPKAAAQTANGFEFSTQPNPNPKYKKQAA